MALVYAPRVSTRDVDATYQPVDEVEAAGAAVGERYGYPPGWINNEVAQFSPPGGELEPASLIERDGVTICVAGPRRMLAMKLRAARGRRRPATRRSLTLPATMPSKRTRAASLARVRARRAESRKDNGCGLARRPG